MPDQWSYLVDAKVGDVFEWCTNGHRCRITRIRDNDIEIHFEWTTGPCAGTTGYTLLPQDVRLVSCG